MGCGCGAAGRCEVREMGRYTGRYARRAAGRVRRWHAPAAGYEEDLALAQDGLAGPRGGRRGAQLVGLEAGVEYAEPLVERHGRGDGRAVVARGDAGGRPARRGQDPLLGAADDGVPRRGGVGVDVPPRARACAADDLSSGQRTRGVGQAAPGRGHARATSSCGTASEQLRGSYGAAGRGAPASGSLGGSRAAAARRGRAPGRSTRARRTRRRARAPWLRSACRRGRAASRRGSRRCTRGSRPGASAARPR